VDFPKTLLDADLNMRTESLRKLFDTKSLSYKTATFPNFLLLVTSKFHKQVSIVDSLPMKGDFALPVVDDEQNTQSVVVPAITSATNKEETAL